MNSVTTVRKFSTNRSIDREPAPEASEPLDDQPGVADPGDRAEPHDHLLVDDQDRDEQQQHPEQARAVVLARLRIGGDPAGVVVADHHDQPGADDREQRQAARAPAPVRFLVLADRPECALDVADVRGVEHEPLALRGWRRRRWRGRPGPVARATVAGATAERHQGSARPARIASSDRFPSARPPFFAGAAHRGGGGRSLSSEESGPQNSSDGHDAARELATSRSVVVVQVLVVVRHSSAYRHCRQAATRSYHRLHATMGPARDRRR